MLAPYRKIGGFTKIGVLQKYRRTIESWRALKSLRLVKNQRIWKKLGARLLFGLGAGGISNCWLPPGLAKELSFRSSLSCRPQVRTQPRPPCFYGRTLSVLYRLLVPARHAKIYAEIQIIGGRVYFHQFLWKLQNSISAPECPITEPKIHMWSLLLSNISHHTHSLEIRGHLIIVSFFASPILYFSINSSD